MIKLLKNMRKREVLTALLCAVLVVGQVYFDLRLPDFMSELTLLIKSGGDATGDIVTVGLKMLACTLASAAPSQYMTSANPLSFGADGVGIQLHAPRKDF